MDQGKPLPEEEAKANHPPPGSIRRRGFTETPDSPESLSKSAVPRISSDSPHPLLPRRPALPLSGVLTAHRPTQTSPPSPSPLTLTPPLSTQISILFWSNPVPKSPPLTQVTHQLIATPPPTQLWPQTRLLHPQHPNAHWGHSQGPGICGPVRHSDGSLQPKTHEPSLTQGRPLWFAYSFSASCGLHFSVCP